MHPAGSAQLSCGMISVRANFEEWRRIVVFDKLCLICYNTLCI